METQINRIKAKLADLKNRDTFFSVFGASRHKYKLEPIMTEAEVISFESKHSIQLPKGYRDFLMNVGSGGAGPYYGLESISDTLFDDLDRKDFNELVDPTIDFPHTAAWNLEFDEGDDEDYYNKRDELYFDKKWITGVLRICNYGCGVHMNIVVKGPERGNIWVDDRGSDGGIYPDHYFGNKEKIDFLTWYELWLDKSLAEIGKQIIPDNSSLPKPERTWWQKLFGR